VFAVYGAIALHSPCVTTPATVTTSCKSICIHSPSLVSHAADQAWGDFRRLRPLAIPDAIVAPNARKRDVLVPGAHKGHLIALFLSWILKRVSRYL
jgi:hypothetical protein